MAYKDSNIYEILGWPQNAFFSYSMDVNIYI